MSDIFNNDIDILNDFDPLKIKFISQTIPTAVIRKFAVEVPKEIKLKIYSQLREQLPKDATIKIEDIQIIVMSS